jgi:hypothetical protein
MPETAHVDFKVTAGEYVLGLVPGGLPSLFKEYVAHAALVEQFEISGPGPGLCCLTVARGSGWPFLVIAQSIGRHVGLGPGALIAPDHDRLFVGGGERLLAYDLREPRRLWEDSAEAGFWGWTRHGDVVLMAAELEFAAWLVGGEKLWSMFVEPPWTFEVKGEAVWLEVMGKVDSYPLRVGRRS